MQINSLQGTAPKTSFEPVMGPGTYTVAQPRTAESASPAERPAPADDARLLADTVKRANEALTAGDEQLQFSIHEGSHRVVIKLVDKTTNEVLREFPKEKFLDMIDKLQQLAGLQVNLTT